MDAFPVDKAIFHYTQVPRCLILVVFEDHRVTSYLVHKATVGPIGLRATIAAMFVFTSCWENFLCLQSLIPLNPGVSQKAFGVLQTFSLLV